MFQTIKHDNINSSYNTRKHSETLLRIKPKCLGNTPMAFVGYQFLLSATTAIFCLL